MNPELALVQRKVTEMIQTLRLAKKTSREDYSQHLRLVLMRMMAVGGIAFVIKLIAEYLAFGSRFG